MKLTIATAASLGLALCKLGHREWPARSIRIAFLGVDQISYLEVHGEVGFKILRIDGSFCVLRKREIWPKIRSLELLTDVAL